MVDQKCQKYYPKPNYSETREGGNGFWEYRRRKIQKSYYKYYNRQQVAIDNRWVVPYNPYLLAKYDAHINVEKVSRLAAVKYLYKYIYKGPDRVLFEITEVDAKSKRAGERPVDSSGKEEWKPPVDEIKTYQDGRYLGPHEAPWRIFGFKLFDTTPNVVNMQVHLKKGQDVYWKEGCSKDAMHEALDRSKRTTLLQWFKLNKRGKEGSRLVNPLGKKPVQSIKYKNICKYFTWDKQAGWTALSQ